MRVAIIGAEGQLGKDLVEAFADCEVLAGDEADLDLCAEQALRSKLDNFGPILVVNAAAFTKVDLCETEAQKAFAVNAIGVLNLARWCEDNEASLIQISTNYVFDGDSAVPYRESDPTGPLNVYGVSKLAGEHFARTHCSRSLIVRTSGLYGSGSIGRAGISFVETMLSLAHDRREIRVVNDQWITPTYTKDLARALREVAESGTHGVLHLTNAGECTWCEFAEAIFSLAAANVEVVPVSTAEYGSRTRRPRYAVLDNTRAVELGVGPLPPWRETLQRYLKERRR